MKCSLGISNFLKRSLVFPFLLFSSISLHWLLRKAFLSLLAILWNSAFKWVYFSISSLLFASFLFTAICKASSDSCFAFLHFFFLGMVLIPVSWTMSWTSIHSSSGTTCLSEWVEVAQSCPTLCDSVDYTVHGILQARILEWVAFPFSRGSSQPRDWTQVSNIACGFFTSWAIRDSSLGATCLSPSKFISQC